jgi:hypothetical protein
MTEIDFALNQKNTTDIIELVGTVLWNKADINNTFRNLSEAEQTFVYIDIFESEINNQGLYGFFYNDSGKFTHQVLQAFTNVKAHETASILNKAIKVFKEQPVPQDITVRRQSIDTLEINDLETWSHLELNLVEVRENIIDLVIAYIKQHKTDFEY